MTKMDCERHTDTEHPSMEEVVLELEWVVHEAARKHLAGQPAEEELADISRLTEMQLCIAINENLRKRQLAAAG